MGTPEGEGGRRPRVHGRPGGLALLTILDGARPFPTATYSVQCDAARRAALLAGYGHNL